MNIDNAGNLGAAEADVADVVTTETDTSTVDTSSDTGSENTSINDVVSVQTTAADTADTSVDNTVYTAGTSVGTAAVPVRKSQAAWSSMAFVMPVHQAPTWDVASTRDAVEHSFSKLPSPSAHTTIRK